MRSILQSWNLFWVLVNSISIHMSQILYRLEQMAFLVLDWTISLASSCSSSVLKKTMMSSRNTSTSLKCKSPTHFSMSLWKVLGVLVTPWGIWLNSKKPSRQTKAHSFVLFLFDYFDLFVSRFKIHEREPSHPTKCWEHLLNIGKDVYMFVVRTINTTPPFPILFVEHLLLSVIILAPRTSLRFCLIASTLFFFYWSTTLDYKMRCLRNGMWCFTAVVWSYDNSSTTKTSDK